jgi:UPF0716 protein FxsA
MTERIEEELSFRGSHARSVSSTERTRSVGLESGDTWIVIPVLFLLLIIVPIVELWAILQVAGEIGALNTVALLIAISALGAWLLKQQGMATWARLRQTLARGQVPTKEVTDGALILFGGALLLTPGFLTDAVGLILLFPPSRAGVKGLFRRLLGRWAQRRFTSAAPGKIQSATVVRSRRADRDATHAEEGGPSIPEVGRGEDDFPDRG